VRCIELRLGLQATFAASLAVAVLVSGCGSAPPAAAPAPAPVPAPTAPAKPVASPSTTPTRLPAPSASRNWNELKLLAARRMVLVTPGGSYTGKPQQMLLAIPVLEIELNADGSVKHIDVMRKPSREDAQDTIGLAIDAVRRAAPYGDVSKLPKPWKFTETFLFNDDRRFKPRTLDAL
jgi:hypothetical protein